MPSLVERLHLPRIYRILFLLAAGLGFAGDQFKIQFVLNLALVVFGVLIMVIGVEEIVTRLAVYRIGGWTYTQAVETYRGLAAQLWGVIFIGLGGAVIAVTVGNWIAPDRAKAIWSGLLGSTTGAGLALAGLGLMVTLNGLIRMLAGSAGVNVGRLTTLSNLLDRLGGTLGFFAGLGLSLIGLMLLIAPGLLNAIWQGMLSLLLGVLS